MFMRSQVTVGRQTLSTHTAPPLGLRWPLWSEELEARTHSVGEFATFCSEDPLPSSAFGVWCVSFVP